MVSVALSNHCRSHFSWKQAIQCALRIPFTCALKKDSDIIYSIRITECKIYWKSNLHIHYVHVTCACSQTMRILCTYHVWCMCDHCHDLSWLFSLQSMVMVVSCCKFGYTTHPNALAMALRQQVPCNVWH